LDDSIGWQEVSGLFVAEGGEEYLNIGYFYNFSEISFNYINELTGNAIAAYYYIDDILLTEIDLNIPNIFTPNNDGVNDLFEINLNFQDFENTQLVIINRWGNIVFDSKTSNSFSWDGNSGNQKCTEGVYFYVFKTDLIEKKGFIELIR
jgi:gliding motility-associated-like protein